MARFVRNPFASSVRALCVVAVLLLAPNAAHAAPIVLDFETLAELDAVGSQIPGFTFTNALVVTAGSLLNEVDFPPHSGSNVILDDSAPISVAFSSPVLSVGGFFTYAVPITFEAFDGAHVSLGTVTSAFLNNTAGAGDVGSSPNEFLQLASAAGISSITITGMAGGSSFVVDDLTVTSRREAPEPGLMLLLGAAGIVAAGRGRVAR